jgi:hypothetical protein
MPMKMTSVWVAAGAVLLYGFGCGYVGDARCQLAVCQRKARVRGGGEWRRHAWNHFERDPLRGQKFRLLGAPAEQVGIAAFEAHHRLAFARDLDELAVDLCLPLAGSSRTLAHEHKLRFGPRRPQLIGMHERIVEDDVRLTQAPEPARGD